MASYDQFDETDTIGGLLYSNDDQYQQLLNQGGTEFMPNQDSSQMQQKDGFFYNNDNQAVGYEDAAGGYQPYFNNDGSAAVSVDDYKPEETGLWDSFLSTMKDWFSPTLDKEGRSQQSLGASVVVGAAQEVLKMMAANKAAENATNMESQKSSNKIKEKTDEENRVRAAASAMPAMPSRGARTVAKPGGILSTAK